jgi:hypothetical protein
MSSCEQAIKVAAIGEAILIVLPVTVYVLEYWLQPDDPLTFPSEVNSAEMLEPGMIALSMSRDKPHTEPVRSLTPPWGEVGEAQAARMISPAHNPKENNTFFIFYS